MKFLTHLALFLLIQASTVWADSKKTLCSMTINSNEEIELFKQHLSKDLWNFVELAPDQNQPEKPNWFKEACQRKINCDILVISGHFGGTFFGSSKSKLSLEELESGSCDKACSGIVHYPKEVFLFGCNTLASKKKDLRTPEEYMRTLLADGFSHAQASQIVSFRYSEVGASFESRMTNVFATVPQIYGFTSKGPSGKTIEPLLKDYLQNSKDDYAHFSSNKTSTDKNEKLFSALKNTSLAQSVGARLNLKSANEKPYCYIKNVQINRLDKIKYIEKLFIDGLAISMLSHVEVFLREITIQNLNSEEQAILSRLKQNQKIKQDLLSMLQLKGDIYIPLKMHVLNTLKELNIINNEFLSEWLVNLIDLQSPFTDVRRDMICSTGLKVHIPASKIPNARWSESEFMTTLLCLKIATPDIQARVSTLLDQNNNYNLKFAAIWYFNETKTADPTIHLKLAKILLSEKNANMRQSASMVLKNLSPSDFHVQMLLAKSILSENDRNVFQQTIKIFENGKIHPEIIKYVFFNMDKSKNKQVIQDILGW